ncbi:MAG: T9SS type A sorting domain-containing protein [Candidatus Marinimicrobia bacterium]|nr:T9SS type A sorting domain-containing protein [Candidatus Neomarinimicrobiota bacterium]MBT3630502.1 T9SS type A sorting domain-containing protein [Candidatus Neomarinimicrobiota bacterium]MBT4129206.1 T9SS type A sorting domain-containing protein [Candidatus Neomarinimicrobiota bacterium]MBT4295800.1 T9SS type A sorting domain-containing protein [Candidatus Neomarinimicrobiota bacterium]MBT4419476.1 T9SS type A sorting domain-containing protein [Candidatus Neomarinimicrobiota bacterium]
MQKRTFYSVVITLVILIPLGGFSQESPRIEINPGDVDIFLNDSLQFSVSYYDTNGVEFDTTASWTLHPSSKGEVDESGWFYPSSPGECLLTAELDTLSDQIMITIVSPGEDPPDDDGSEYLFIAPTDTLLVVGDQIQFEAFYGDTLVPEDSVITWSLLGMPIGALSEEGLLQVESPGFALIEALSGDRSGASFIIAADSSLDTTGINHIQITRDSPNPNGYTVMRELEEGEYWKISGLPHPLNILNGSSVYFPVGCLSEDIRIHVALPGFFQVGADTVEYGHNHVVAGVQFKVMTDDSTVVEPYYFNTPLIAGMIYKRGLLSHLGLLPENLGLYFGMTDGDSIYFDDTGITHTIVDEYNNRIYSAVAHFSELVVAGDVTSTLALDDEIISGPESFSLYQNYPNPFNPSTNINYSLNKPAEVSLSIFDIAGRELATFTQGFQTAGQYQIVWNGKNSQGSLVSTGVYFCRLQTPTQSQTVKMVLLR